MDAMAPHTSLGPAAAFDEGLTSMSEGSRVKVLFHDSVWHEGTVDSIDAVAGFCRVHFDRGDRQTIDLNNVVHAPIDHEIEVILDETGFGRELAVGQEVQVLFADGQWHPGQVVSKEARTANYFIQFHDGDREWFDITRHRVKIKTSGNRGSEEIERYATQIAKAKAESAIEPRKRCDTVLPRSIEDPVTRD